MEVNMMFFVVGIDLKALTIIKGWKLGPWKVNDARKNMGYDEDTNEASNHLWAL